MTRRSTNRHVNEGLRKVYTCLRRDWAKCKHSWHFNYKTPQGPQVLESPNQGVVSSVALSVNDVPRVWSASQQGQ